MIDEKPKPFTREEFIAQYNSRNFPDITGQELIDKGFEVCLPCCCDYDGCRGWAMVSNVPHLIESHNEFYNPETRNP
jgi:hypothetical protein